MKKLNVYLIGCVMALSISAYAQGTKPIVLYPNGVPNSKPAPTNYVENAQHSSKITTPTLTPFLPDKIKANGASVIICPGGSYIGLSMDNEGFSIAREFNKIGVAAFVLTYRLPSDEIMVDKTIGPLQDAQSAIVMIRSHATEWGLNPNKVGIIGFSAGGHLASTAATHFNKPVIENNNISVRPDFAMLLYPVISFGEFAHKGSRENLIGKTPSAETIELYSNEKQVTANTPITFLVHAEDDKVVPVQNSLLFYEALVKANVNAELHIFQAGGHGFGLNNSKSTDHWFDWCRSWMELNGLLNGR